MEINVSDVSIFEQVFTGWFVMKITRPDESGWFTIDKIPWWRGGGTQHVLVPDVTDCTQLEWAEIELYSEMQQLIPETEIEVFEITLTPGSQCRI